jgi:hypothetical protein
VPAVCCARVARETEVGTGLILTVVCGCGVVSRVHRVGGARVGGALSSSLSSSSLPSLSPSPSSSLVESRSGRMAMCVECERVASVLDAIAG